MTRPRKPSAASIERALWREVQACCLWGILAGLLDHWWFAATFALVALGIGTQATRLAAGRRRK